METPEQKMARHNMIKNREMLLIEKGGVSHDVWVTRHVGLAGMKEPVSPTVQIANDEDGWYVQAFRTRRELEAFIAELRDCANDAWPKS